MAQTQAEEQTAVRSRGKVVRFSDRKGFGFIKPDDGGDDLFVHHSAIKSDGGYRSLNEDDVVEFSVSLSSDDNKYQAINVTAPGGGPISASNSNKRVSGAWNSGRRNNVGPGGACYNCGGSGHMARDCNASSNGGGACYKCGNTGHFARDCNARGSSNSGGGGGGGCYSCGGYGHLARDCPGGSGACYNCGGFGHLARDCTSGRGGGGGGRFKAGNSGGGGGGGRGCFNCGEQGHLARECPNGGFDD